MSLLPESALWRLIIERATVAASNLPGKPANRRGTVLARRWKVSGQIKQVGLGPVCRDPGRVAKDIDYGWALPESMPQPTDT